MPGDGDGSLHLLFTRPATAQENAMKAIVHSRYGPPDALELRDIDQPVITDDQVLVRVHAAAVGKGDWLTVQGLPYVARMRYGLPRPKHPVPGSMWPGALRRSAAT